MQRLFLSILATVSLAATAAAPAAIAEETNFDELRRENLDKSAVDFDVERELNREKEDGKVDFDELRRRNRDKSAVDFDVERELNREKEDGKVDFDELRRRNRDKSAVDFDAARESRLN